MGEIYRATDTNLKRAVAIKVLPSAVAADVDRLARFQREAEVLGSLNHPNIAIIHDLEKSGGVTALVMELVEGPTLADRIASAPIPVDETLRVAMQVAEALEAAHERGIIHRDLKPANVKVGPDGTVKVLDFGLAKATEPTTAFPPMSQSPTFTTPAMTQPGVFLGTAAYMAPEQARGYVVDKRADIWAFGAVLYEMLTGRPAFMRENVTDTLAAIVKEEPNWEALPSGVEPSLVWVLRRCLQKDPKQRLRDIGDIRLALNSSNEPLPVASAAASGGTPLKTSRRRASMLLVGGIMAGLATGLAVSALLAGRGDEPDAISRFVVPFRPSQQGGQLAFSADGLTLVYQGLGADGRSRLYRRSMDTFDSTPIGDTENGSDPFFSHDGRWLGFVVGRTLKRVSVSGGPAETIAELPIYPRGASWDAESIVVGGGSEGLLRVPFVGGKPTLVAAAVEGRELLYPQVLPGGRAVLFTESRFSAGAPRADAPELQILELDTKRQRSLVQGSAGRFVSTGHIVFERGGTLWGVAFDPDGLDVRGSPVPLVQSLREGMNRFAVAEEGSLAYLPATSAAPRKLVWVDRAGREEAIAAPPRGYTYPRLSPDGTRVAIDVRDEGIDIWIWSLVRETLTRLTFDPAQDEYPVWAQDGQRIFFASFRENAWGVFVQSADGSGVAQRVGTDLAEIDPLSLSLDGRTLVARFRADVVTLRLGQSREVTPLLTTRFEEVNAEISPDSRWIAYQSNESGRHEVYVRPFPAVASGLWQISNGGGTQPLWARNGRELFYVTPSGLMSVPIQAGPSFAFGNTRLVLKGAADTYWLSTVGRSYDVSPDASRFLMVKEEMQSGAAIHVVRNWQTELNRLVPTL
jgi:serine/threonine-protein kinase